MSRTNVWSGFCLLGVALAVSWAFPADAGAGRLSDSGSATALSAEGDELWLAGMAPAPAPEPDAAAPDGAAPAVPPDEGPAAVPPAAVAPPPTNQGLYAMLLGRGPQAGPSPRLAGVPNMFGDFFNLGGDLVATDPIGIATAPLPLAGASRRVKVAENNKALPMDRVHFMYNHFHDALDYNALGFPGDPGRRVFSVNRFTIAAEKTLMNRLYSVEVRMPFTGEADFNVEFFGISGGDIGNLAVLLKRSLWQTRTSAAVIGLAIDLPTGSDVHGFVNDLEYTVYNEAVHLGPFAGLLWAPDHRRFAHAFLQVDVPASSNSIDFYDTYLSYGGRLGELPEQTALYLDVGTGYWLYRNPRAPRLTGVAALLEVHYATTLTDASLRVLSDEFSTLNFANSANRVDEVNLTVGLHAEFTRNTLFRVAGVFPLRDDDDRSFGSEIQAQVERRF